MPTSPKKFTYKRNGAYFAHSRPVDRADCAPRSGAQFVLAGNIREDLIKRGSPRLGGRRCRAPTTTRGTVPDNFVDDLQTFYGALPDQQQKHDPYHQPSKKICHGLYGLKAFTIKSRFSTLMNRLSSSTTGPDATSYRFTPDISVMISYYSRLFW